MSADELYLAAAARIRRLTPVGAVAAVRRGALLIDLRPTEYRLREGEISGAIPVPRHVLEWRLDPHGDYRLSELAGADHEVVLMCSEGYSSALAADLLQREFGAYQHRGPRRWLRSLEGRRPALDKPRPPSARHRLSAEHDLPHPARPAQPITVPDVTEGSRKRENAPRLIIRPVVGPQS